MTRNSRTPCEERLIPGRFDRALDSAAAALKRGLPVPVILGAGAQKYSRYALILQVAPAGISRALSDRVAQRSESRLSGL